jgi:hypothetical protein
VRFCTSHQSAASIGFAHEWRKKTQRVGWVQSLSGHARVVMFQARGF